ncbi:UDP-4-amino-4-deoxy-L-arabinose--oxoglutarate aminotransferase [subsurface metagenome]
MATDDNAVAERLRAIRHRGHLNFQTTDIASAIGRVQLKKLSGYLETRAQVAQFYREALERLVSLQYVPMYVQTHVNMMFPIFVDDPKLVAARLRKLGVDTRLGWPPLNDMRAAKYVSSHILTLPIYNTMPDTETEYVIKCVKKSL